MSQNHSYGLVAERLELVAQDYRGKGSSLVSCYCNATQESNILYLILNGFEKKSEQDNLSYILKFWSSMKYLAVWEGGIQISRRIL